MSKRSPLDFYHQFLWKIQNPTKSGVETKYICTKCHEELENYGEVVQHCETQDCENVEEEITWLEN